MTAAPKNPKYTFEQLINEDFLDDSHLEAFAHALQLDEQYFDHHTEVSSPTTPGSPAVATPSRIRKVSALSDFAPINLKVQSRRKRKDKHRRHDWWFLLLRWPLLIFIFLFIAAEFGLYVLIRQVVNGKEWISAWRGKKGQLRKKLRAARTYEEWKEAAKELDRYLNFDEWKKIDEDAFYDWKLVRKVRRSLRNLREKGDARGCLGVLETCIRPSFAAVESPRLYSETFLGTKDLIESYFDELEKSLEYIRETPDLSLDEKKRFFKSANTNLGVTALCLSGGATLGYYHFGVIKAFLDQGLLPRVITGTSAGGLIAALTCTRTDEELKVLLVPELAQRITACEEPMSVWFQRFMKTGARFDSVAWARKCAYFTRGSMTFKEAYLKTGRILNVSVIPADRYSPTKLLNYITAPDTVIWSALLASAAVPGILNPVVLMQKLKDGNLVPWNWGSRFKDGSLRVDVPTQALNLYFNVTNPVVSQANPHVHLFFFAPRGSAGKPVAHRKGKGWRGNFLLSAAEQWLKHELTKNFRVIRDLELLPTLLGQDWSSVFLQRFDGSVTIWPRPRFMDFIRILSDPDPPELERMLAVGQLVTWPKLHMIDNRIRIEKAILAGRRVMRTMSRARNYAALQPRAPLLHPERSSEQRSKEPSPIQTASERPISVDTDAEEAFSQGSQWFYRRGRARRAGSITSDHAKEEANYDPLSSFEMRRKWASDLLNPVNAFDSGGMHSNRASPERQEPSTSRLSPTHFFRRLHSFHSIHLPLSSERGQNIKEMKQVSNNEVWSSESSDEGNDEHIYSHSFMNLGERDEAQNGEAGAGVL
ncbi:patatin-domain-containing protein [Macrolepiota fuliginosa MF-IS2]|uniref:Patatin-like phospholipase domain-containing protein n=1 Tax=Macrolepiota fuliginosa MF-IS2 TaxID=1400762 RepID=A0A9P5XLJ3_9AGAR|nr:patatin-domain-containing protein [Macrolepiota fuliginosa MF-IS2]